MENTPCTPELPTLIQAMLEPARYPHPVLRVDLVQTHISWILLAGDFAYKVKKPLKLPFLDFSTLELRRIFCLEELRLNRRYAADIYLSVLRICGSAQDPVWEGDGAAVEYALRMRRFDDRMRLDRMCVRGELEPTHLSDLANALREFHLQAAPAPAASRFGAPAQVRAPALDNCAQLAQLLPGPVFGRRLQVLRDWTLAQCERLAPLMASRKERALVRECHGDLHLENLVLLDGRVRMFDCIEFNQDLRWIDLANEYAFPYMDLLARRQPGLAGWLANELLGASGDYQAAELLRFYAVYRALVRAKVAAIRAAQRREVPGADVLDPVALAEDLLAPAPPRMVITHGLSGCGKTHASGALLRADPRASTLRLRSDVERKRIHGLSTQQASSSQAGGGIYTQEANAQTYDRLHQLAAGLLRAGWSVIVDAAFLQHAERARFQALAAAVGAPYAILAPNAPMQTLGERILARGAIGHDASEATLEVLEQQVLALEPLSAAEEALRLAHS